MKQSYYFYLESGFLYTQFRLQVRRRRYYDLLPSLKFVEIPKYHFYEDRVPICLFQHFAHFQDC